MRVLTLPGTSRVPIGTSGNGGSATLSTSSWPSAQPLSGCNDSVGSGPSVRGRAPVENFGRGVESRGADMVAPAHTRAR
jgi:hypothetical protein